MNTIADFDVWESKEEDIRIEDYQLHTTASVNIVFKFSGGMMHAYLSPEKAMELSDMLKAGAEESLASRAKYQSEHKERQA